MCVCVCESQRFIHADDLSLSLPDSQSPVSSLPGGQFILATGCRLCVNECVCTSVCMCVCVCLRHCRLHLFAFVLGNSQLARHSQKETATKQGRIFWQFFCHTHTHTHVCECGHSGVSLTLSVCVCAAFAFALFAAVSVVVIILQTDFPFLAGYGAYARYGDSLLLFVACSMQHVARGHSPKR